MSSLVTRAAFTALFDDAAIFPPGNLEMQAAVVQHGAYRRGEVADLVGPFVCSTARLDELTDALESLDRTLEVALVIPPGAPEFVVSDRITVVAIEQQIRAVDIETECASARTRSEHLRAEGPIYLEFPQLPLDADRLAAVAAAKLRLKFRTGGVTRAGVPSADELARAIYAAREVGVSFKCTAGLHHAAPHLNVHGDRGHGFLNVLLAARAATVGSAPPVLAEILDERSADVLAAQLRATAPAEIEAARSLFVSFGTCSIDEPLTALRQLDLIT